MVYKDLGLVSQVFDEATLASLRGHLAVGHTRYSTTGASTWENAQPTFRTTEAGTGIALCHNGNLVNTAELAEPGRRRGRHRVPSSATTDSDLVTALIARPARTSRSRPPRWRCCRSCAGAFSFTFMDETRSTPPATPRASGRWCWAGWSAAGWSPARPRRWTSSAPPSSARSSPAS